jgi:hypothetical protein
MGLILSNAVASISTKIISWRESQECKPSIRNVILSKSQYIDTDTWTLHPREIQFDFRASDDEEEILRTLFDYNDRIYLTLIDGENSLLNNEVIHLPFCEGYGTEVTDYSGSGFNGTVNGGTWVDGKNGKALEFSGNFLENEIVLDSFLEAPYKMSLSAWVNLDDIGSNHHVIGKKDWNSWGFGVSTETGKLIFVCTDASSNEHFMYSDDGLTFGETTHICVTYDGSNNEVKFYINGQNAGTTSFSYAFGTESNPVYIGQTRPLSGIWPLKGVIDDVRAWSRVLSQSEILELYNNSYQMWVYSGCMSEKSINYKYSYESHDDTVRPWLARIGMDIDVFGYTGR